MPVVDNSLIDDALNIVAIYHKEMARNNDVLMVDTILFIMKHNVSIICCT